MKTIELDLQQYVSCVNATLAISDQDATGMLIRQLNCYLAVEHQNPVIFTYPKTWWEMFKADNMPTWFLKKWPVKYNEIKLKMDLVYPYLKTKLPRGLMGNRVVIAVADEPVISFNPAIDMTMVDYQKQPWRLFSSDLPCPSCGRLMEEIK